MAYIPKSHNTIASAPSIGATQARLRPTVGYGLGGFPERVEGYIRPQTYLIATQELASGAEVFVFDVFDVTAPPVIVGTVATRTNFANATGTYVYGDYAYVVGRTNNMVSVIDISDPLNPSYASQFATANSPGAAGLSTDGYLYIANNVTLSLQTFDLNTSPTAPTKVSDIASVIAAGTQGMSLDEEGDRLWTTSTSGDSITCFNVAARDAPVQIAVTTDVTYLENSEPVASKGGHAFLNSGFDGQISSWLATLPSTVARVGGVSYTSANSNGSAVWANGYTYSAETNTNGMIYFSSDPTTGSVGSGAKTTEANSGNFTGVTVDARGEYLYATSVNEDKVGIFNVSNGGEPLLESVVIDAINHPDIGIGALYIP